MSPLTREVLPARPAPDEPTEDFEAKGLTIMLALPVMVPFVLWVVPAFERWLHTFAVNAR